MNTLFAGLAIEVKADKVIFSSRHRDMETYNSISDVLPIVIDERFTVVKIGTGIRCFYGDRWHYKGHSEDFYSFLDRVARK